jgi:HK97 gp10 family phage protein
MANEIEGLEEVMRMFREVGEVSQKIITKAAKTGAKIVQQDAKSNAPKDTGKLKRSIKMKAEKRKKGKKVYDIKFVGDDLAKIGKNGERSFYPVSQEYGWMGRDGNKIIPKKTRFLRNAKEKNDARVKQLIINELKKGIEEVRGNGI